jgi:hypothetical protein
VVGHVLVYDGMPLEELAAHEGEPAESVVPYRGPIAKALSRGQAAQDRGATWRQARDAYVSYLQGIDRAWCP